MARLDTDILVGLIEAKRETLRQLRDLGVQQQSAVDAGDGDKLLRVLTSKQRLLGDLQQLEQALEPFRSQDPDQRNWRTGEDRARCASAADECSQLLADVIRQERESEQALSKRRDDAALQLRVVQSAMHLQQRYGAPSATPPHQLDITCGQ